ncbi:MAG: hypothetical protein RLZZ31_1735 [Actinomycetota bacterium]
MNEEGVTARASLRDGVFLTVIVMQFVLVMVNGSGTMALPSVKSGFDVPDSDLQWFAALFFLGYALVLVAAGRLGDIFGPRRLLLIGYAGFIFSTTLAATAPTIQVLLLARLLQGVSGGLLSPQLSAIIQRLFLGHERTRAFAIFLFFSGGAFMVGQISAGALMTSDTFALGWRWAFLPFIPFAAISWLRGLKSIPKLVTERSGKLDIPGAVVLGVVSFFLMFPLIQGRNAGWPLWVFLLLACAIPAAIVFITLERRIVATGGDPLVNPVLFRLHTFRVGNVLTLLVGLIAAAVPLYLILTIQIGFGRSPFAAALLTFPMPFSNMFGSLVASPIMRKFGRGAVAIGAAFTAASAALILILTPSNSGSISVFVFIPSFALLGFALGISIASTIAIVLSDTPQEHAGSASGVQATGSQLAGSLGIALYGVIFYAAIGSSDDLSKYLVGIDHVMWVTLALCAVQVAMTFRLPRHTARENEELPPSDLELLVLPDFHQKDN